MYTYRILQNWREDTFHSSILTFEKHSYLFNCCDGTQRNALDQGVKFSKIKSIFFNSAHSECYLGIYGLLMSRGEQVFSQFISQKKNIGNSNTKGDKTDNSDKNKETAYSKKNKIMKDKDFFMPKQAELLGPPLFSSNFINSTSYCPVPINKGLYDLNYQTNSFINSSSGNIISLYKDDNVTIIPICINKGSFANKNDYAMSYIIIPSQKSPPFLIEKAKKLGLKAGPGFGKLQKGESVFLENGTEIKPEMVLGESEPSSSLCIFYIPSIEYMKALITNQVLLGYLKDNSISNKKRFNNIITVHIIPTLDIINNSEYKKFMDLFGKESVHIIDCKETNRKFMYNEGKMKIKKILNYVDSSLFSNGAFTYEDTLPLINLNVFSSTMPDMKITESIPGVEYILFPLDKKGMVNRGLYDNEAFYPKSEYNSKFTKQIEDIIANIIKDNNDNTLIPIKLIPSSNIVPIITFFGTISMKPCKFRNVTSIMIHLPSDKYVLFDCGEGTYQQILEHNGIEKTNEIISKMRLIAISHKHGDHMLGLIKILCEADKQLSINNNNTKDHFYIIVPKTIIEFVKQTIDSDINNKSYFIVVETSFLNANQQYVYNAYLSQNNPHEGFKDIDKELNYSNTKEKIDLFTKSESVKELYSSFQSMLGINVFSIEVFHCDESFGYFIESSSNQLDQYFKISFSGDTRPNNNFFNYSMDSSVLIHEGTFDDELVNDAKDKMHSTIGEAIALGKNNNSKMIIITHFSQRYIKSYPYKELFDKEKILLAHDYLSFSINDHALTFKYLKLFDKIIKAIEEKDENIL